jgi:AmmeMemoRadiSam system protein B/AmmeMemoRadiSam system protein A
MRIFFNSLVVALLVLSSTACGQDLRTPAVSGQFYPAGREELKNAVDGFVKDAGEPGNKLKPIALLCPHAGYEFSGPVAGAAYRAVQGQQYDTVVLVGNSHRMFLSRAAVYARGAFATPLGQVPVDDALAAELIAADPKNIIADVNPHSQEHSLEVQVPFIQRVLPGVKILPILAGVAEEGNSRNQLSEANYISLGKAIAKACRGKNVLLVASSDLTHYPSYQDACRIDQATLAAIQSLDPEKLAAQAARAMASGTPAVECALCGGPAVKAVMLAVKELGADKAEIIRYANSGDRPAGDKSRVVGYGAVAFYQTGKAKPTGDKSEYYLDEKEQRKLLDLARQTLEAFVSGGKSPEPFFTEPRLTRLSGAFVTLKKKGALRGCIGHIQPIEPLGRAVRDLAIASASEDPRFSPVQAGELKNIDIEISVLSPIRKVKDASEIELGKHGVIVKRGGQSGVFLPQVAEETGWTKEQFLDELCTQKAGLPADAWKDPGTSLFVFTAQVFGETK